MFFKTYTNIPSVLEVLKVRKLIYDKSGHLIKGELYEGEELMEAYESIFYLSDRVDSWEPELFCGNTVFKITFPQMKNFYELCREESKSLGIALKNNQHYKSAEDAVDSIMNELDGNSYCWSLRVPRKDKNKKVCNLIVEVTEYFYEYVDLVTALYEIREYYINAEFTLRQQINERKNKIIKFNIPETKEKAA